MYKLVLLLNLFISTFSTDVIALCKLESFSITDKEDKVAKHFQSLIKDNYQLSFECLEFLIQRSFYRTAVDIYENYFILNQIDISQELETLRQRDRSLENKIGIQHIFKNAQPQNQRIQTVQPIMVWAQSKNHTLLNIKFSHRIDTPGCINVKIEEIRIEANELVMRAFGIVSHNPIRYETHLNLFQDIVPELSSYRQEAVGTIVFNLTKAEPKIWLRLTQQDVKTGIWWDLHDQLKKDMDEFVGLLELESIRKEKDSDKKYRKVQKQREQEKKRQDKQNQIEQQRLWDYERNQCNIVDRCENGWYQRS